MKLFKNKQIPLVRMIVIILIVSMLFVNTAIASDSFTLVGSDPIADAGGKVTDGSHLYCTAIDYDNDGDQDFLSLNGESGENEAYWFYENDGSGGFTEVVPNVVFPIWNGYSYLIVDIDNDGDEDIMVPNGSGMAYYKNDGTGNFALASDPITSAGGMGTDGSHLYCTAIDYDNDGDQDFLSLNGESGENEAYWFYKNDGSGNFTETLPNVVFPIRNGYSYLIVDIDNDGDEDIMVPNGSGMAYYKNDGTGNFALESNPVASAGGTLTYGSAIYCINIDYDIDGDQDFLSWNGETDVNDAHWFYENDGAGNFTEVVPNVVFPKQNGRNYLVADIDNDGDEDIMVPNGSGLSFFRQDGTAPAVNTAPSITTNNGLTLNEGATGSLKTHLVATDNEQDDAILVYTVTDLPDHGLLVKNGVMLALNGTFTQAQLDAGIISYVHDCTDTTSDSFTFNVSDGAGEEVTGHTFNITITPVNDNPTISGLPTDVSVVEDTLSNVDLSAAILTDDSGSAPITLSIRANPGGVVASSGGGVTVSGSGTQTITLSGTVTDIDTYLNTKSNIKFVGAPNAYGNDAATLTLTANDGGNTGIGGGTDVSLGVVNMDIMAVNDPPYVIKNLGLTLNEGAAKTIATTALSAGDVETASGSLTFTVTSGPSNGQLGNTDNPGVSISSFTQQNLIDGKILYTHNGSNTVSDSFTFKVVDDEGGEKTGQTFSITVNAVDDDAPTISKNDGMTLNEGATKSLKTLLTATDTEQSDATLTYTVTSSPSNGSLSMNTFTQAQLDAGSVMYTHDGSNMTSDSFIFKVDDGATNEVTGQTFSITVNPVDDDTPSIAVNKSLTLDEGSTACITTFKLSATDADTDDGTLIYTVTSSPLNGQLENTDNPDISISSFTQQNLIDGKIQYVHDGSDTISDSFTFNVADGAGNELTGETFSITVNPVDDPPAPTPTPTPTATPDPTEQFISVKGKLLDDDGNPLVGYTVELHSTPRIAVTDAQGRYAFNNVEIEEHSLIVKDKTGTTLKSFTVTVTSGDEFSWQQPNDDTIATVVQEDTASIDVTISISDEGSVTVDDIDNVVNPKTGVEGMSFGWLWVGLIAVVLIVSALLLWRKRVMA